MPDSYSNIALLDFNFMLEFDQDSRSTFILTGINFDVMRNNHHDSKIPILSYNLLKMNDFVCYMTPYHMLKYSEGSCKVVTPLHPHPLQQTANTRALV